MGVRNNRRIKKGMEQRKRTKERERKRERQREIVLKIRCGNTGGPSHARFNQNAFRFNPLAALLAFSHPSYSFTATAARQHTRCGIDRPVDGRAVAAAGGRNGVARWEGRSASRYWARRSPQPGTNPLSPSGHAVMAREVTNYFLFCACLRSSSI